MTEIEAGSTLTDDEIETVKAEYIEECIEDDGSVFQASTEISDGERIISVLYAEQTQGQGGLNIVDFYVWSQGPNYALAKQLQRWRAIIQLAAGHTVSVTIGPATLTESVMHNKLVRAGILGCAHFGTCSVETFTLNHICVCIYARMRTWVRECVAGHVHA